MYLIDAISSCSVSELSIKQNHHLNMTKENKASMKEVVAVVKKTHVFLEPAQQILSLTNAAFKDLQNPSNKSKAKKAKIVIDLAKKATAVASEANKKYKAQEATKKQKAYTDVNVQRRRSVDARSREEDMY